MRYTKNEKRRSFLKIRCFGTKRMAKWDRIMLCGRICLSRYLWSTLKESSKKILQSSKSTSKLSETWWPTKWTPDLNLRTFCTEWQNCFLRKSKSKVKQIPSTIIFFMLSNASEQPSTRTSSFQNRNHRFLQIPWINNLYTHFSRYQVIVIVRMFILLRLTIWWNRKKQISNKHCWEHRKSKCHKEIRICKMFFLINCKVMSSSASPNYNWMIALARSITCRHRNMAISSFPPPYLSQRSCGTPSP